MYGFAAIVLVAAIAGAVVMKLQKGAKTRANSRRDSNLADLVK